VNHCLDSLSNSRPKGRAEGNLAMRKAHLFEALYLVNQGVDEAVRGLERLKRTADFQEKVYADALAKLESRRAHVNLQFFDDMQAGEQRDASHFQCQDCRAAESHDEKTRS
jgi:hypothetical protein